jgi:hypothetical protein
MKVDFDPKDPQRMNCTMDRGGKRGRAVPGDLFALTDTDPDLNGPGSRWPWRSEQGPNQNSVVVTTDANGLAGVCFKPSRMSGDVYRIRAYVEASGNPAPAPDNATSDQDGGGFSLEGKPCTTGKLTVWRSVRIHRFLQKPVPNPVDPMLHEWVDNAGCGRTIDTPDLTNDPVNELMKAFIQLDVADAAANPLILDTVDTKAHNAAVQVLMKLQGQLRIPNYDYTKLLTRTPNKPYLVQIADPDTYNASAGGFDQVDVTSTVWFVGTPGGKGANSFPQVCNAYISSYLLFLTGDADPGLTLVQALAGDEATYSDAVPAYFLAVDVPLQVTPALGWRDHGSLGAAVANWGSGRMIMVTGTDASGSTYEKRSPVLNGNESLQDLLNFINGGIPRTDGKRKNGYVIDSLKAGNISFVIPYSITPHHGGGSAKAFTDSVGKPGCDIRSADGAHPPANATDWDFDTSMTGAAARRVHPMTSSGHAYRVRGAALFCGKDVYDRAFNYTVGKNALHELSHVLYLRHQMTPGNTTDNDHDFADVCVMSYDGSPLGKDAIAHCGKCLLSLRGWDINRIPPNPGKAGQRRPTKYGTIT